MSPMISFELLKTVLMMIYLAITTAQDIKENPNEEIVAINENGYGIIE